MELKEMKVKCVVLSSEDGITARNLGGSKESFMVVKVALMGSEIIG